MAASQRIRLRRASRHARLRGQDLHGAGWTVIRYLVVLECFLVALLISPWFGSAPSHGSRSAEQSLTQAAAGSAEQSPAQPPSGGTGTGAFSARDRAMLAAELLDLPYGASRSGQPGSSRQNEAGPHSSRDPVADGSVARTAPNAAAPITDQQSPVQETRADGKANSAPSPSDVVAAQRLLGRLGYSPGAADGVLGERTQRALAQYRRRTGAADDGQVLSEALLAQLRRDASRAAARKSQSRRMASRSPRRHESAPGWVGSVAGGFQRLLGHEFDSRKQPGRIRDYCRDNKETWIFDEGRGAFAYCGHLLAAH